MRVQRVQRRSDSNLRLAVRAVRERWPVPREKRARLVEVLFEAATGPAGRDRTAAVRALIDITRHNVEALRAAGELDYADRPRTWRASVPNWDKLRREVRRLKERHGTTRDPATESARWDWYAAGCPCGVPAGACREHPRARPAQRPPGGDWRVWLILAGRGFGKTVSAAQWVRHRVETGQARRVAIVGATAADVRDVMVEGPSGLLAVCPPWNRPRYEPSKRRLTWPNGAMATTFTADEPDRLRGPQSDLAWVDELAAFRYPAAVDNLLFGLRLGDDPRLCVTTTPKPVRLVTDLVKDPTTAIARGTTFENRNHLAPSFFERIVTKYEGTRLGQQELWAELLEVSDGAWFPSFDPAQST